MRKGTMIGQGRQDKDCRRHNSVDYPNKVGFPGRLIPDKTRRLRRWRFGWAKIFDINRRCLEFGKRST